LRILHVGSGFRPWRRGGLVAYVEDLMGEQVRRGHDVSYVFAGRLYPYLPGPRLRRWRRDGVSMLEITGSPLFDHGRQPELEVAEPRVEALFRGVLDEVRPEVVHVQELAGLPFSVLDLARESGAPVLLTLQDYFPLCATFRLFDAGGRICLRREVGADCLGTAAADPREPDILYRASVEHDLRASGLLRLLPAQRRAELEGKVAHLLTRRVRARARRAATSGNGAALAAAYQRRRDTTVERLNRLDSLVAMSGRVAEIYAQLGVDADRIRTMQLTLAHIERLTPRQIDKPPAPVTFATLGGGESVAKGVRLLLGAARELEDDARAGRFRVLVFGHVDGQFREELEAAPGVELRGTFAPGRLDALLDEVDVGLMPSIWEEAYGYAGVEFLAKGIPVLANAIGGMPEYVRDGETGWLNRSCDAAGLAAIMRGVIERPEEIAALNAGIRERREEIVMPLARHAGEVEALYDELLRRRASTVVN
jgi:glycosyltransferase involved in cell wall biosynthesis